MNEDIKEKIECLKDRLENINATLSLNMPDSIHVQCLRDLLPELIEDVNQILERN